jgi:hypothetical protein
MLDRQALAPTLTAIRAKMCEEAFATSWAEGRAMTLEQAIAYALDEAGTTGGNPYATLGVLREVPG